MKLEIEISDSDVKRYIEEYIDINLRGQSIPYGFRSIMEKSVEDALTRSFKETNFSKMIENECNEIAMVEIKKAAKKKIPGWVTHQIKNMLKYAYVNFLKVEDLNCADE